MSKYVLKCRHGTGAPRSVINYRVSCKSKHRIQRTNKLPVVKFFYCTCNKIVHFFHCCKYNENFPPFEKSKTFSTDIIYPSANKIYGYH